MANEDTQVSRENIFQNAETKLQEERGLAALAAATLPPGGSRTLRLENVTGGGQSDQGLLRMTHI